MPPIDGDIRRALREHFAGAYGDRVEAWVDELLALDPLRERYAFLESAVGKRAALGRARTAFVSGFGAGSEMLVAHEFGFELVKGVEVDPFLVSVCRRRVDGIPGMEPISYDGMRVPLPDASVDTALSGHIVEHTADPRFYLRELARVLVPGGHLYIEFPTRWHARELHTGLPSLEWLPRPLRDAGLRFLSSRLSPLDETRRRGYESIVTTRLKQVSLGMVRRALAGDGARFAVAKKGVPRPGIVRCVLRRVG